MECWFSLLYLVYLGELKNEKEAVSKFGSFSSTLENGIQLSLSYYGPTGEESDEETDLVLARILNIPSVHLPTVIPETVSSVTPAPGKKDKSDRGKPGKASAKGNHGKLAPSSPDDLVQKEEQKMETQEPVSQTQEMSNAPAFPSLNASCPNGLVLTFLGERFQDLKGEATATEAKEEMVEESKAKADEGEKEEVMPSGEKEDVMQSGEEEHQVTEGEIKQEDTKSEQAKRPTLEILVRQSYPQKTTMPSILFADGTVSNSPDSGPVLPPPTIPDEIWRKTPLSESDRLSETSTKKGNISCVLDRYKNIKSDTEMFVSAGKGSDKTSLNSLKSEESEKASSTQSKAGTWITTTPLGIRVGTEGATRMDMKPLLMYQATDPADGTIMTVREDEVVIVEKPGGDRVVEHADGTRITTFYEKCEDLSVKTFPHLRMETDEPSEAITKKLKGTQVENPEFATVITNCEDGTCCTIFGDGTSILAKPQGTYQVLPSKGGFLFIDEDCSAVYSHEVYDSSSKEGEKQAGRYIMKHTSSTICEMMDPEGNTFKVLADGSTDVCIPSMGSEEDRSSAADDVNKPITDDEHVPRFFIISADGSGTELLREKDVHKYMAEACSDPATAVLQDPVQEQPGVLSITILHPMAEESPWVMKKEPESIVPPYLQSGTQKESSPPEEEITGHPIRRWVWKSLGIGAAHLSLPVPVRKCPQKLQIRQLFQYKPLCDELREKLQLSLKEYMDNILKQENELEEMNVKEPRTEEEKENAATLLEQVTSFPDWEKSVEKLSDRAHVRQLYEQAVTPPAKGHTRKTSTAQGEEQQQRREKPLQTSLNVEEPSALDAKLKNSAMNDKPTKQPPTFSLSHILFAKIEDPASGKVSISSLATRQDLTNFHLIPPRVTFGVLKEGCTYATTVIMKNVGVNFSRFRVKQPPPHTGLRVMYTPGPVAAGLQVALEIEIFAMLIGGKDTGGLEEVSHDIEILTEIETLLLPVKANILSCLIFHIHLIASTLGIIFLLGASSIVSSAGCCSSKLYCPFQKYTNGLDH
ncbi:Sperm-associated antigen 17 [Lonchura striata]|uniref:Sperm-associated antigen 17 n=1 Tax=Lonchura striata TaxID=40157 RepID=A0A218VD38_9PASE|nr:Sperm-associated antigen 17 [Lonchura striata domestica]